MKSIKPRQKAKYHIEYRPARTLNGSFVGGVFEFFDSDEIVANCLEFIFFSGHLHFET